MKTITICVRGLVDRVPSIISTSEILKDLGYSVVCLCDAISSSSREALIPSTERIIELTPQWKQPSSIGKKVWSYLKFRREAWEAVKREHLEDSVFWVVRIDTARALGRRLAQTKYIFDVKELHDTYPAYQKHLKLFCRLATKVVAREATRAAIMRVRYGLKETPCVLPNKPLTRVREPRQMIADQRAKELLEPHLANYKILLYQGWLGQDRDLRALASAASCLRDFRLVLMGDDPTGFMHTLLALCPSCVHIPFVPPPGHLEITSNAHIGIATYGFDTINDICCAPNKIWEYAGFGVPMVCQNVPGLMNTIGQANAGICVDFDDERQLASAINKIDSEHESFSGRATRFFDSVDISRIIQELVESVGK